MHTPYDLFAKDLGLKLLGPTGVTAVEVALRPEKQTADLIHEPNPANPQKPKALGLLGQLTDRACILEFYSGSVSSEDFRACLTKHLVAWKQRENASAAEADTEMFLWIISADRPKKLLSELKLDASPTTPGVYLFAEQLLRVGFVVASELPRKRETLIVRLMAGGREFGPASMELRALPPDTFERLMAEQLLLECAQQLKKKPELTPTEKEFQMAILKCWEDSKAEGREEGRVENQAQSVLTVLRLRGVALTDATRERILAEHDLTRLTRWHEKAVAASTISEVLDEPA